MSPLSISSIVVSLWLAGCLAKSTLIGWREYYGRGGVGVDRHLCGAQQTPGFDPMLFQYFNIGPPPTALDQHWNNIGSSLRVCWESCPHFDTRVPSVSGWNRLHSALCTLFGKAVVFLAKSQLFGMTWVFKYCGEPPWPRGSVLGLRSPGLEFRILCLEDSVISIISPSSGGSPGPV